MIRIRNCGLTYRSPTGETQTAVEGVDLHIRRAEFVCVLGPSGCGKTSLLNMVAGFVKPTSGDVLADGRAVTGPGPDRGVVFQDPTLFPWLTVRQNVEFGLRHGGRASEDLAGKVDAILAAVGMQEHEHRHPHALSGGMRQRVALARVLVLDPSVLLLDEPFSALDANTRERLQDFLLDVWNKHRRTVLYVTHSIEEAAYLGDRVLIMGPPPASIRNEIPLPFPRPRNRLGDGTRIVAEQLRAELTRLPCCVVK